MTHTRDRSARGMLGVAFGLALPGLLLGLCAGCERFQPDPALRAEGNYLRGTAAYHRGDLEEAAAAFAEVAKDAPDDTRLPFALGELYLSQGKLELAKEAYTRASRLHPARAAGWTRLGFVLARSGEVAEAQQALSRALALDAGDSDAHEQLAELALRRGRQEEAVASFTAAARSASLEQRAELYLRASGLLEAEGKWAEGRALLERAVEEGSADADLRAALGDLQVRTHALDLAAESYARAAEAGGDGGLWELVAEIHLQQERPGEAAAALERAVASGPRATAHLALAELRLGQGRRQEAEAQLELALGAATGEASEVRALAALLEALGRGPQALVLLGQLARERDGVGDLGLQRETARLAARLGDGVALAEACGRLPAQTREAPDACP